MDEPEDGVIIVGAGPVPALFGAATQHRATTGGCPYVVVTPRSQALPGNALYEALPPDHFVAEPQKLHSQAEPGNEERNFYFPIPGFKPYFENLNNRERLQ